MLDRKLILTSIGISFLFRLMYVGILFLSAREVDQVWLQWVLLIIASISLTRGLYRLYRVALFAYGRNEDDDLQK